MQFFFQGFNISFAFMFNIVKFSTDIANEPTCHKSDNQGSIPGTLFS